VTTAILLVWFIGEAVIIFMDIEEFTSIWASRMIIPLILLLIISWAYTYYEHKYWICRSCFKRLPETVSWWSRLRMVRPADFTATECSHCNVQINYKEADAYEDN
jgi:hypothetical protein